MKEYSPSEHFEAKEKFKRREEGRKEALPYRAFIYSLQDQVTEIVDREYPNMDSDIISTKLRDIKGLNTKALEKFVRIAEEQSEVQPTVDIEVLADMTPSQFDKYIDQLDASIIT